MDLSKWHNPFFILILSVIFTMNCDTGRKKYTGNLEPKKHQWLIDSRIYIDPGHGGLGKKDQFRMGPGGITEEDTNLRVALILADMLKEAGAIIKLSRRRDSDIGLPERVESVKKFNPHLLVSIHHNGSPHRMDNVNYPTVIIWGSRDVSPASYDIAEMLIKELNAIMDQKGYLISDFALFPETGTMILRETRYTCPGIIGEGGFFSDEMQSKQLRDLQYLELEAEAYFKAISEYFKRGVPSAEVKISCPVENTGYLKNTIRESNPEIFIFANSGSLDAGIDKNSFRSAMDGFPVKTVQITNTSYKVDYGRRLYPGGHNLRFSFQNSRSQHSVIYSASFNVAINKGDYDNLIKDGTKLISHGKNIREGVLMLRAALSMGVTDPKADSVIWRIAEGYSLLGDRESADYQLERLYHFYPQSGYRNRLSNRFKNHRYPVAYLGKQIGVEYDPDLKNVDKK